MKKILLLWLCIFLVGGYFSIRYSGHGTFLENLNKSLSDFKETSSKIFTEKKDLGLDKSKEIALQQVNNLGYTFYIGQVDYFTTPAISDSLKNKITQIVYNAHFPKNFIAKIPIIILNSLAVQDGQYISTSGRRLKVINLDPSFLSEGGIYSTYESNVSVIYINKSILEKNLLTDVLTHELGHAIGSTLTDDDWKKYYGLRNIPANTPRIDINWILSPAEDFAEVYKNTFTGLSVQTSYGTCITTVQNTTDPKIVTYQKILQDRIDKANEIKKSLGITPTHSCPKEVSQETKDFINDIVDKP